MKTCDTEKTLSECIGRYDAGEYVVTAARWSPNHGYGQYDTYEIGIKHIKSGTFTLLQSEKYNFQSVQEVANAIAHLLTMSTPPMTERYTPEWMQEYMT